MMPSINKTKFDELLVTDQEQTILNLCLNGDRLRASKPTNQTFEGKMAQYVWRNTAFVVSPFSQHQCMPVLAFCDLPKSQDTNWRVYAKWGDALADKLTDCFDKKDWHGVIRWGRALGKI